MSASVRAALAQRAADLAPALGAAAAADVVLPLLLTLLRDDEADVRLNVVSRLAPIHAVIGVDALAAALLPAVVALAADAKWRVRRAVVELTPGVCEQLGADAFDLATRDVCAGWLDDPVAAVRTAAVDTLARLAPTLGAAWTSGDALPRVAARRGAPLRRDGARALALAAAVGALDGGAVATTAAGRRGGRWPAQRASTPRRPWAPSGGASTGRRWRVRVDALDAICDADARRPPRAPPHATGRKTHCRRTLPYRLLPWHIQPVRHRRRPRASYRRPRS